MKELQPNILDDFEHRITVAMEHHGDETGFPQLSTYGVTREQVDDYLFDYQAILDSEGSPRTQQTTYGIIAVIPIVIMSAFPQQSMPWTSPTMTVLAAAGVGMALAAVVKAVRVIMKRHALNRLRAHNATVAAYVDAVDGYEKQA